MPLKSVEPITLNNERAIRGIITNRGIHFSKGLMSEDALLGFIYDSSKIYNLNTGFYRSCLLTQQKPAYKVSEEFIAKIYHMFRTNRRPSVSRVPNALILNDFYPEFDYGSNVTFLTRPTDTRSIRNYINHFKPKVVATDAECCAVYNLPSNRSYDYIAFAFNYTNVFIWYRPKRTHLKDLYKFFQNNNVTVLHWGAGDKDGFVTNQLHMDLQPLYDGTQISLNAAAQIFTGKPLDKGLTMGLWSTPPEEMFVLYREFFDYLIMDVLILLVIYDAYNENNF
uniref:Uncharacterized protein n=1 Tax=Panagrolaimus sp. ES5 TaxID=591445 RepID=A0AC34FZK0_9BILA